LGYGVTPLRVAAGIFLIIVCVGATYGARRLPAIGAAGLLHPARHAVTAAPPAACQNVTFAGLGITLEGWRCQPSGIRRGTLVYLHGIADTRTSAAGVIERFVARGFEVIAYDSRAHGESGGDACTYGYFEKADLSRVLDTVGRGPVVLIGTSLGAAVALQAAANDVRVSAIVAADIFSDLRTVATERAPFFFTHGILAQAFDLAEQEGDFTVDAVSPRDAAARVTAPVLLIHGAADTETPPDHSRRVFDALRWSKQLRLVPGASHNESLRGDIWRDIEHWVDDVVARAGPRGSHVARTAQ
jgi:uncharacterized protein